MNLTQRTVDKIKELLYKQAMEKKAMTLGAAKSYLRMLQAQGVNLIRDNARAGGASKLMMRGKEYTPSLSPETIKMLGPNNLPSKAELPEMSARLKNSLLSGTGAFHPATKTVYIPRKYQLNSLGRRRINPNVDKFSYIPLVGKNYNPLATFMHEAGHAQHYLDDPLVFRGAANQKNSIFVQQRNRLALERIANNNAILHMRQQGVPESKIREYSEKIMPSAYKTYTDYAQHMVPSMESLRANAKIPKNVPNRASGPLQQKLKTYIEERYMQSFINPRTGRPEAKSVRDLGLGPLTPHSLNTPIHEL